MKDLLNDDYKAILSKSKHFVYFIFFDAYMGYVLFL